MPYGDRTGPVGAGPMTGRRMGYCASADRPGSMRSGWGFGFRMGRSVGFGGHGRGWRNQYWATGLPGWARGNQSLSVESHPPHYATEIPREEELRSLKSQSKSLENNLSELKKRIVELEGAASE